MRLNPSDRLFLIIMAAVFIAFCGAIWLCDGNAPNERRHPASAQLK